MSLLKGRVKLAKFCALNRLLLAGNMKRRPSLCLILFTPAAVLRHLTHLSVQSNLRTSVWPPATTFIYCTTFSLLFPFFIFLFPLKGRLKEASLIKTNSRLQSSVIFQLADRSHCGAGKRTNLQQLGSLQKRVTYTTHKTPH